MAEQKKLMHDIMTYDFALLEATLFLDTHPNQQNAMAYYSYYQKVRDQAVREYERLYGPITNKGNLDTTNWVWANGPWPWEGE